MSMLSEDGILNGYIVLVRGGEILTNQGMCALTNEEINDIEYYLSNTRKLINSNNFDEDEFNDEHLNAARNDGPIRSPSSGNKKRRPKIPHAKRLRIFNKYHGKYYYCHKKLTIDNCHIDNMMPVSRGGSNDDGNLALACPKCNESKGNLTEKEDLQKIGDLRGVEDSKD